MAAPFKEAAIIIDLKIMPLWFIFLDHPQEIPHARHGPHLIHDIPVLVATLATQLDERVYHIAHVLGEQAT